MSPLEIIGQLVETRVNGNSIVGNKTYENMLKRVTKEDIIAYSCTFIEEPVAKDTKINMIEQIRTIVEGY